MEKIWMKGREMLAGLTPLKKDCGRICGARCCSSLEEGMETGMLLFPGEEDYYESLDGWKLLPSGKEMLLVCPGKCNREDRPLSCRIFPLVPVVLENGKVTVRMDERARAVCPLANQGKKALDPDFVKTVQKTGELLSGDPQQLAFLHRLTAEQEELRQLRRLLQSDHE